MAVRCRVLYSAVLIGSPRRKAAQPMTARPPVPLGRHIDERREELGLTLREVARASGLTVETLRAIRYGENVPRGLTRAAIERALRWEAHSIDRILSEESGPAALPAADDAAPADGQDGHAAVIAAIRSIYTGDAEGDEAAIVDAVRRRYPGDTVAAAIMGQDHKTLDERWAELDKWFRMHAAAQA